MSGPIPKGGRVRHCRQCTCDYVEQKRADRPPGLRTGYCTTDCDDAAKRDEQKGKHLLTAIPPVYVFRASEQPCEACKDAPGAQWHHLISRQSIRHWVEAQRLDDDEARTTYRRLISDARNLIRLCSQCHMSWEGWAGHGPRSLTANDLPSAAWDFAADLGLTHQLEKSYPEAANRRPEQPVEADR